MYAINTALGRWISRARGNRELARRVQCAFASLRQARGIDHVRVTHVRAHARVAGNEVADRLAKRAADGDDFEESVEGDEGVPDLLGAGDEIGFWSSALGSFCAAFDCAFFSVFLSSSRSSSFFLSSLFLF